jgi:DNA polymerase I
MDTIYLIDASGFLYRGFFAIQGMSSKQGEATGALFGFIRSYLRLVKDFQPKYVAAIFDGEKSKEVRTKLYPEYKAHRKPTPDELIMQIQEAKRFCTLCGIATISAPGVEADDTIASVTAWAKNEGLHVCIVTSDKDLAQLIDETTTILNPHKDYLQVDAEKAFELYGVKPYQMRDFLAICGDASDNVPGISGFGPKTAISLLQKYETLENILAHTDEIGGKKAKTLHDEKACALLSQKLVSLYTDVAFDRRQEFFAPQAPDKEGLLAFLQEKSFRSLYDQFSLQKPAEKTARVEIITTQEALTSLVQTLKTQKEVSVDTETTDENPMTARLVGMGLATSDETIYYIPFTEACKKILEPFFSDPTIGFYGHNIKYDLHVLKNAGMPIQKISGDTILSSYLLNAHKRRHSLDALVLEYFGKKKIAISELLGKGKAQITMDQVPMEQVAKYCAEDVEYTVKLKKVLDKDISKRNLNTLLEDIELPLISVLCEMEETGIFVDKAELQVLSDTTRVELDALCETIYEMAGETFNLNSPKQLGEILYGKLGIMMPKKGKTQPSTSAEVLETLAPMYPIAQKVLLYRTIEKLRSGYIESLPHEINPKTGRIHCTFNQSTTATGRLSCQNPNLQNIPVRSELGKNIRKAFKPEREGYSFLSADYSQIELRILAHVSGDKGLLDAFHNNVDVHAYTASEVFNIPIEDVTDEMRQQAKAVNFGVIYGQQAYGLSQALHIPMQAASHFIEAYFKRYSSVKTYIENAKQTARDTKKAVSLTGRERLLPDITSSNQVLRLAQERLAVNTPFQATAADIIKMAMLSIDQWLKKSTYKTKMLVQIHDELLFEVPDSELEIMKVAVKKAMEGVFTLNVPLIVEIALGKNWKEC